MQISQTLLLLLPPLHLHFPFGTARLTSYLIICFPRLFYHLLCHDEDKTFPNILQLLLAFVFFSPLLSDPFYCGNHKLNMVSNTPPHTFSNIFVSYSSFCVKKQHFLPMHIILQCFVILLTLNGLLGVRASFPTFLLNPDSILSSVLSYFFYF